MPLGKRKEAEMKPTPRSARMGAIADALMAARDWADKAQVPEAVPLLGGQGLGSLMLGKAPEELNEMSYGNMPLRINPLAGRTASYVPEMKAGRKEQVADLAMLASVPKVGKAGVGLAGAGDVGSGAERALIGYHGTPHRFERFDASKIGTGEGQQVYGYGLYFAESPDVAKGYAVPRGVPDVEGIAFRQGINLDRDMRIELMRQAAADRDPLEAAKFLQYANIKAREVPKEKLANVITEYRAEKQPSLYTVDIPDEMVGKMLDWDISIGEQPEAVQKIFNKLAEKDRAKYGEGGGLDYYMGDPYSFSGETIYKYLEEQLGGKKEVSAFLQKEGIPGVKYFDQFSRDELEGTRNIVVFPGEEKNIKILKRNEEEAPKFAKGGMMKPTIEGFQDGGTAVEPTTGNDVPVGSLPNEVADDIDAKLSEGEFVLPADVVRYIGLERLMKLRDDAKKGLQRMAQIGQMGNAEEVGAMSNSTFEGEDEEDTSQFESDIDEILSEDNGVEGQTERMMAAGGLATMPYATGTDLSKAPKNPVFDVRYLKHNDGRVMYITYINGKPLTPIPEGFRETTQEDALKLASAADEAKKAAEKKTETPTQQDQQVGASAGDVGGPAASSTTGQGVNTNAAALGLSMMGMPAIGLTGLAVNALGSVIAGQQAEAMGQAAEALGQPGLPGMQTVSDEHGNISTISTTTSVAASDAGLVAEVNAIDLGLSPAAAAQAGQQAAAAVNNGVDPETAIDNAVMGAIAASPDSAGDDGDGSSGVAGSGVGAAGGTGTGSAGVGPGWAKGGLINKRKPKAKRGKGIVAQK